MLFLKILWSGLLFQSFVLQQFPPNSTQEDLAPLMSPQLSIPPNSFINAVVSLPHTVKTPKPKQREKEIPAANHKGAQTGVSASS